MPNLLLELGLEEVPARMIGRACFELTKSVSILVVKELLANTCKFTVHGYPTFVHMEPRPESEIQSLRGNLGQPGTGYGFSTPRRLTVIVKDISETQPDRE